MPVKVTGPDGNSYSFPDGTDKDAAVSYFKQKGIGASQVVPPVKDPAFDPATQGPMSSGIGVAGPGPTGVMPWLNNFQRDVRLGTDNTAPGKVLKFLGYPGYASGIDSIDQNNPSATMGDLLPGTGTAVGAAKMAHGAGTIATGHPILGANEIMHGFGQVAAPVLAINPEALGPALAYGAAGTGVQKGAEALGVSPDTSEFIGNLVTGLMGARKALGPSGKKVLGKLAFASGPGTTEPINAVKEDLANTVAKTGQPQTVGDFLDVVNQTKAGLNSEYANTLGPHANKQIMPNTISQRILGLITPNMDQTALGRAQKAMIQRAATDFQKPWTLAQLDSERMDANARLNAYEKKGVADQYASTKSNRSLAIDKAIADGVRETVYPMMDQLAGKGTGYFSALKGRIGNLIQLESSLSDQVPRLADLSARIQGAPAMSRAKVGTTIGSSGEPRSWVGNILSLIHTPNPEGVANSAVKAAYPQTSIQPAIAALPIKALLAGDKKDKSGLPPGHPLAISAP